MAHTSHDSAHTEILIRRSKDNGRPVEQGTGYSLLRTGEMAYSYLYDPNDDGFGNGGDRLYIGVGDETILTNQVDGAGDSYNRIFSAQIATIGGRYFTDMMNHQRGIVTPASALLVDDNKKLNELLVDYLYFDKDSVSTEATNDLTLRGGTGEVIINSNLTVTKNTQIDSDLNVDGITTLDSTTIDGDLLVTRNVEINGTITVDGIATFRAGSSGSIQMGDENTDNVVFGADVNSNVLPNITDTYDLGSTSQRWNLVNAQGLNVDSARVNDLTEDRVVIVGPNGVLEDDTNLTFNSSILNIGVDLNVDGITTLDSTTVDGNLLVTGDLNVDGITTLDSTTVDGNLLVTGDLTVNGVTTTINSTELTIDDKRIIIAQGSPDSATSNNAGIAVGDSASPIAFMNYNYNSGDARWEFQPKIFAESLEFEVIDCGTYA